MAQVADLPPALDGGALRADRLAVIIPTRERWPILARTLAALRGQTVQGFETVVVIDGDDQTIPRDLGARDDVRLLRAPRAGPGAARNRGVDATERPWLLLLGDDMLPTPELIRAHLERHAQRPARELAVLGHVEWHPEVARDRVSQWLDWSGSQFDYTSLAARPSDDVGFGRFYSCNVSLDRELFLEAGGFDTDFAFDYEDLDLGWRLHQLGMQLAYEPKALAQHLHRYRFSDVERRYAGRARAERLMMRKHSWFSPWFHERIALHVDEPEVSRIWPLIVEHMPRRPGRLKAAVRARADRWYHQQLAPAFLSAWEDEGMRS